MKLTWWLVHQDASGVPLLPPAIAVHCRPWIWVSLHRSEGKSVSSFLGKLQKDRWSCATFQDTVIKIFARKTPGKYGKNVLGMRPVHGAVLIKDTHHEAKPADAGFILDKLLLILQGPVLLVLLFLAWGAAVQNLVTSTTPLRGHGGSASYSVDRG